MRHQMAQMNANIQPYNPRTTEQVPQLPNPATAAAAGSGWSQPNNKFMSSRRFSVNPNFRRRSLRDRVSAITLLLKVIFGPTTTVLVRTVRYFKSRLFTLRGSLVDHVSIRKQKWKFDVFESLRALSGVYFSTGWRWSSPRPSFGGQVVPSTAFRRDSVSTSN